MDDLALDAQHHVRVGRWRGDTTTAHLASFTDQPLDHDHVARCLDVLRARGYHAVITSAIPADDQSPYVEQGFTTVRELLLLRHDLRSVPPRPGRIVRRVTADDRPAIAGIDRRAFDDFWRFADDGLDEAMSATPLSRLRVVGRPDPLGYAVSGVAGRRGYLQRLAVVPEAQGQGLATKLVADALRWMVRRGATDALVNTQVDNRRATRLYEHLGFRRTGEVLGVLRATLDPPPRTS